MNTTDNPKIKIFQKENRINLIRKFSNSDEKVYKKSVIPFEDGAPSTIVGFFAKELGYGTKEKVGQSLYLFLEDKLGVSLDDLNYVTNHETKSKYCYLSEASKRLQEIDNEYEVIERTKNVK